MSRLQTVLGNITFQSPFILASAPPTRTGEMIARAFAVGWDAAVTKTICLNYDRMIDVSPRIVKVNGGLKNIELISPVSPEKWAEDIRFLKKKFPQKTVIASISAEADNIAGWQKLTLMMQEAGTDALELNFSCPHGLPEMGMGNTCSDIPELAENITKCVKDVATIPVWAKLSPNVTNIKHLAKLCEKAGADGISAINTVKGFAGIDIETGMPKMNVNGSSTCGGLSGSIIKPIALKAVADIALAVNCPISGMGGIRNWQDSLEFVMLGSTTVQICTEVMLNGYGIIHGLKKGMESYLDWHCIKSLQDVCGKSLKYLKNHSALDNSFKLLPQINTEKCVKCGKCCISCNDAGFQAISMKSGNFPVVDSLKCTGCGLCYAVCPTCGCLELVENASIS